jgi:hypothetical protein
MYDFKSFTFGVGAHVSRKHGMCVMETVAYIAGEPHSDHPQCACPVISAFMRSWNDGIKDDGLRRDLVGQFVFRLPGTKATPEIELQRSWMAFDWLVRECTAEFLSLSPALATHSQVLRGLPEIGPHNLDMVVPMIQAAWDAARDAAVDAAWAAAWAAAVAAARDALQPSVERLQASAVSLVDWMIRLTEIAEVVPQSSAMTAD